MGRKTDSIRAAPTSSNAKVKEVFQLLQKEARLNKDQVEYCNEGCIERYLRARSGNVKKAAKQLRASLSWRESLEIGYLTADDFPAELAAGVAFVAGQDNNQKPVLVLRTMQEFLPPRSQKRFVRFLVFSFEVAVASMPPGIDQWVMLIDFCGSAKASSSLLSFILSILKLISEHYPERLASSFFVDAPSMFYYLWKGMWPFIDHSTREKWSFAFLKDHAQTTSPEARILTAAEGDHSSLTSDCSVSTASFRYHTVNPVTSYEERLNAMSFLTPLSSPGGQSYFKRNFDHSLGAALASDVQHRSLSFSSPASFRAGAENEEMGFYGSPVFLRSSRSRKNSREFKRDGRNNSSNRTSSSSVERFRPYVKFYKTSYCESSYRATMKPPHGGLLSLIKSAALNLNLNLA